MLHVESSRSGFRVRSARDFAENSGLARRSTASRNFWRRSCFRIARDAWLLRRRMAGERQIFPSDLCWATLGALPRSLSTKSVDSVGSVPADPRSAHGIYRKRARLQTIALCPPRASVCAETALSRGSASRPRRRHRRCLSRLGHSGRAGDVPRFPQVRRRRWPSGPAGRAATGRR